MNIGISYEKKVFELFDTFKIPYIKNFLFYHNKKTYEIDLVFVLNNKIYLIEIKNWNLNKISGDLSSDSYVMKHDKKTLNPKYQVIWSAQTFMDKFNLNIEQIIPSVLFYQESRLIKDNFFINGIGELSSYVEREKNKEVFGVNININKFNKNKISYFILKNIHNLRISKKYNKKFSFLKPMAYSFMFLFILSILYFFNFNFQN